ncbi:MAG: toxin [Candidatus Kapabacteria bacterium]|nr:toxin [Candidatus Kapabacteria bacterium]
MKKSINWNEEKNNLLKKERNIGFEIIADKISNGDIIDDIFHPNSIKYSNQRIFVIEVDTYIYLVPYVETIDAIFLKTIYPSRKFTKLYFGELTNEKH